VIDELYKLIGSDQLAVRVLQLVWYLRVLMDVSEVHVLSPDVLIAFSISLECFFFFL